MTSIRSSTARTAPRSTQTSVKDSPKKKPETKKAEVPQPKVAEPEPEKPVKKATAETAKEASKKAKADLAATLAEKSVGTKLDNTPPKKYVAGPSLAKIEKGEYLKKGHKGKAVRSVQEMLIANGAKIKADGKYGPKTQRAVRDFQQKHGLKVDGLAGPETLKNLQTPNSTSIQSNAKFQKLKPKVQAEVKKQLDGAKKDLAARKNIAGLATGEAFGKLNPTHQQQMLQAQSKLPGDAGLTKDLGDLAADPKFTKLNDKTKSQIIQDYGTHAKNPEARANLKDVATTEGFAKLKPKHQSEMLQTLSKAPKNKKLAGDLKELANHKNFQRLGDDAKSTTLQQLGNHPKDPSARATLKNLAKNPGFGRMADKDKEHMLQMAGGTDKKAAAFRKKTDKLLANPAFQKASSSEQADKLKGLMTDKTQMPKEDARKIIDQAMKKGVTDSDSDDFVRNNVNAAVLEHATPKEKAHMLKCLMDGPTGKGDEKAMGRIMKSVKTPEEMKKVLDQAGGAHKVYDELESQRGPVMDHYKKQGENGAKLINTMAEQFPVKSSLSDDFVANHVDSKVLKHASTKQKSHMLKCLMDGPTGSRDEKAMARVLKSVDKRADMKKVLADAGGVEKVLGELGGQQDGVIKHLKSKGDEGHKMIVDMATAFPVKSSKSDDFVRNHVDDKVLKQASVDDKAHMIKCVRDGNFSKGDKAAMKKILVSAKDPIELMTIADKAGGLDKVLGMNADHKKLVTDAFNANKTDAAFNTNFKKLLADEKFQALGVDEKTAVLSQVKNYPKAASVHNMTRLLQKKWFGKFNLADKQRSLKMIAYISQHPGDRTIIDNSVNRFLDKNATYTFNWKQTGTSYGSGGEPVEFNRRYLAAGNGKVNTANSDTLHMVTHTLAHEVNHRVNGDSVAKTADYFMQEYRAYYVGFKAQHGRAPTRNEILTRVRHLLTANSGAYDSIRQALADPTEGPKIVTFMKQVLGRNDVTQANAATLAANSGGNTAPAPTSGDLDN